MIAQLDDPSLERGDVKLVNADIPLLLHADFKAACTRRQIEMQDILTKLVIDWLQK